MNNGVQYAGSNIPASKQVWFTGTTVLRAGQALCFNENGVTATKGAGIDVKVPTSGSAAFFAGFVNDEDAGKTGPCWLSLIQPTRGDVLTVEVDGTTDVAAGDELTLSTTSTLEGMKKNGSTAFTDHPILVALAAQTANALVAISCFVKQI